MPTQSDEALVLDTVQRALIGAIGDMTFDAVLQHLVDAALDLVHARYAALGVPDGEGGFSKFITAGMTDDQIEALGPLPRTHGILGAMLDHRTPYRAPDIQQDPRFGGWWPRGHPDMHSFLGYPLVFKGDVVGSFYLTDKIGAETFTSRDERLVGQFVPHAAVIVELARLYSDRRELSIAEERTRMARELHDSLTQTLFGARLAIRTAAGAHASGGSETAGAEVVGDQLERASQLLDSAFEELRALIWDLQAPNLERDGLAGALRKQLALVQRTTGLSVDLEAATETTGLDADVEHQVLRIVQEAVTNAARHAGATQLMVTMGKGSTERGPDPFTVEVTDDGSGFDPQMPAIRSRRLGLTSMQERAAAIEGRLSIESAPGRGTLVRVEVPRG